MRFTPVGHHVSQRDKVVVLVVGLVLGALLGQVHLAPEGVRHTPRACANETQVVPRVVHATGTDDVPTWVTVRSVSYGFTLAYRNDSAARAFIAERCGDVYATAFDCLAIGAFRADLFRMCALYAVGGVYMDSDLLATKPLDAIFDMCQTTISWDAATWGVWSKKQMAFMAGVPGDPLFLCHMREILRHVKARYDPWVRIAISGPIVFHRCYRAHGAAVGLIDLGWPRNVFAAVPTSFDYPDVVALQLRSAPGASHLTRVARVYRPTCML